MQNEYCLAAPQVNVSKRIVVIDVSENRDQPIALINPEIISTEDEVMDMMDGCLSIPDFCPNRVLSLQMLRHWIEMVMKLNLKPLICLQAAFSMS